MPMFNIKCRSSFSFSCHHRRLIRQPERTEAMITRVIVTNHEDYQQCRLFSFSECFFRSNVTTVCNGVYMNFIASVVSAILAFLTPKHVFSV